MKKHVLPFLLIVLVTLLLASCGSEAEPAAEPAAQDSGQVAATAVPPTPTLASDMAMDEENPDASSADEDMATDMEDSSVMQLNGSFVGADSTHQGSGQATITTLDDGSYQLSLNNFSVTSGPDLHVILSPTANPAGSDDLGDYLDLGMLQSATGDQTYTIPAGTDLSQYGSVVIYCEPFHVVFATASLVN